MMTADNEHEWITVKDAALATGRSTVTIYRWINDGDMTHSYGPDGRTVTVRYSELMRLERTKKRHGKKYKKERSLPQ